MGLFTAKRGDDLTEFERLAVREFARAGRRGEVVRDPDDPLNTHLVADGVSYGFANLYIALGNASPRDRRRVARAHVAGVTSAARDDDLDLDDPTVLTSLRARLLPEDIRGIFPFVYARPFAPGLLEALCVDLPHTVQILADEVLEGRDLDELFTRGRENLALEEFERGEIAPGIQILEGASLFVASQLLRPGFAQTVVGAAPTGWVFAVPDRHTLIFHVLDGRDSMIPVSQLAQLVGSIDRDTRPGGLVSDLVFFTDGTIVQQISRRDADGVWVVEADGPFLHAIDRPDSSG